MGTSRRDIPDDLVRGILTPPDAGEPLEEPLNGEPAGRGGKRRRSGRRGRPPKTVATKGRNVRLDDDLYARVRADAFKRGWSNSDVIRYYLEPLVPKYVKIEIGKPADGEE